MRVQGKGLGGQLLAAAGRRCLRAAADVGGVKFKGLWMPNFSEDGSNPDTSKVNAANQLFVEAKGFDIAPNQTFRLEDDGDSALELLRTQPFDLLLLDLGDLQLVHQGLRPAPVAAGVDSGQLHDQGFLPSCRDRSRHRFGR